MRKKMTSAETTVTEEEIVGTVKWFNDEKGYGFIAQKDSADVFVHHSGIIGGGRKTLHEGDTVKMIVTSGAKGLQAENVDIISKGSH
jgi:CspA family cold shock protein